jgi:hypothetical protein
MLSGASMDRRVRSNGGGPVGVGVAVVVAAGGAVRAGRPEADHERDGTAAEQEQDDGADHQGRPAAAGGHRPTLPDRGPRVKRRRRCEREEPESFAFNCIRSP